MLVAWFLLDSTLHSLFLSLRDHGSRLFGAI
jgi:hypothetical protein